MKKYIEGCVLQKDESNGVLKFAPLDSRESIKLNKLISVYENIIHINTKTKLSEKKLKSVKRLAMKTILRYSKLPEDQWQLANLKWHNEYVD